MTSRHGVHRRQPGVLRSESSCPWRDRARIAAARGDRRIAILDHERAKLDLIADVDRRFAILLAEQSRLDVARENQRTADTLVAAVASMVEVGEVSPIEEDRARADRSLAGIGVRRAEAALLRARVELSSLWGGPPETVYRAEGALEIDPILPAEAVLDSIEADAPDLAKWDATVERSEADLRAQRWSLLPDDHGRRWTAPPQRTARTDVDRPRRSRLATVGPPRRGGGRGRGPGRTGSRESASRAASPRGREAGCP